MGNYSEYLLLNDHSGEIRRCEPAYAAEGVPDAEEGARVSRAEVAEAQLRQSSSLSRKSLLIRKEKLT